MVFWHILSRNWGVKEISQLKQFSLRLSALLLCGLLWACAEDVTSQDHLERARLLLEQSSQRAAITELKNALRKDLGNGEARALLGKIYFKQGQYSDAEKELRRAYETDADRAGFVPALAQVLLGLRDYAKLEQLNLDGLGPEGRSIVQAAKGLAKVEQGDLVTAAEIMEAAMSNDPVAPFASVARARLLMAENQTAEARAQLQGVLESKPGYMPAWNLLGDLEAGAGRPAQAVKAYSKALKSKISLFDARLNRAMMYIYMKRFKQARNDLDALKGRHWGAATVNPGYYFARAITQLQMKQYDLARKSFQKSLEISDAYPLSYYFIAAIDVQQGMYLRALPSVDRFIALVPQSVVGPKLAAELELRRHAYRRAVQKLQPIVAERPDDIEALNLLALSQLAQGRHDQGVRLLSKIAKQQPESPQARARLGVGMLATGKKKRGLKILQDILEVDPGYEQVDALITMTQMRQGSPGNAVKAAQAYRERNPDSVTSYNMLAQAYIDVDDRDKARVALLQALALRPEDPAANISIAEYALEEGDYAKAREHYQQVLDGDPAHLQALMKMASAYALEGREQEMFESIEHALTVQPWAMEPRLLKARYYIGKGQLRDALDMMAELTTEQREHPDALLTQASFELAAGRYNHALMHLRKLVVLRRDVAQHYYMRSKAYAGLGWGDRLPGELKRTIELDPDHFYARMALARLARLALGAGNPEKFERQLAELRKLAPGNIDVMKLEVVEAQRKGDDVRARSLLESLLQRQPGTENIAALAAHLGDTGDAEEGIALLQNWLEDHEDDIKVRQKLASLYRAQGQMDELIEQYLTILEFDEEHIIALNNLGWYLLEEEPEDALEYAGRAFTLYPESSSVLDTLALAQMKNDRLVEARRSIDRALVLSPDSPELRFHEIQIRVAEGAGDSAQADLMALLVEYPQFSETAQARAFMEQFE